MDWIGLDWIEWISGWGEVQMFDESSFEEIFAESSFKDGQSMLINFNIIKPLSTTLRFSNQKVFAIC